MDQGVDRVLFVLCVVWGVNAGIGMGSVLKVSWEVEMEVCMIGRDVEFVVRGSRVWSVGCV